MEQVLTIDLISALDRSNGKLNVYVLPSVAENSSENIDKDTEEAKSERLSYILTYFYRGDFYLITSGLTHLGDESRYLPGMKMTITSQSDDPEECLVDIKAVRITAPTVWHKSGKIKDVSICHGQPILCAAPPGGGKSYMAKTILDTVENYDRSVRVYRNLFGERPDDDLGNGTVDCNSSAILDYQLYILYREYTMALRDAHGGMKVIIGTDSYTRMIETLTNKYAHTHLLSGGISSSVKSMVSRLFRMSGKVGEGYLSIVATALWAKSNSGWKSIYLELSSVSTAEFFPHVRSGKLDYTRREPTSSMDRGLLEIKLFGKIYELEL